MKLILKIDRARGFQEHGVENLIIEVSLAESNLNEMAVSQFKSLEAPLVFTLNKDKSCYTATKITIFVEPKEDLVGYLTVRDTDLTPESLGEFATIELNRSA